MYFSNKNGGIIQINKTKFHTLTCNPLLIKTHHSQIKKIKEKYGLIYQKLLTNKDIQIKLI